MTRPLAHVQTWALLALPVTLASAVLAMTAGADRLAILFIGLTIAVYAARRWRP